MAKREPMTVRLWRENVRVEPSGPWADIMDLLGICALAFLIFIIIVLVFAT